MTKKERIQRTLNHEQTDIVPYNIEFTEEQYQKIIAGYNLNKEEFNKYIGNHCSKVSYNLGGSYIKPGFFKDEFGVIWDRSGIDKDIGVVTELKFKDISDSSYSFPEPDIDKIREVTINASKTCGDTFLFGKIGLAFFERAWSLCGFQDFLMYFALEPDFVKKIFNQILEYNLKIIDAVIDLDIDGFYFGDDYGQQSGMLMSPETWREFIKPGLAEMFARIKSKGKVVALHSCGNIKSVLPDLIDIGLDIYQTVQPEVYDLAELKKDYGKDLCFWGAISTQKDLPFQNPKELEKSIKNTLNNMSVDGGFIAGPTHRLPPDIPVENVRMLIETLRNQ